MYMFKPQPDSEESKEQRGTTPEVSEKKKEYKKPAFTKMSIEEAREKFREKGIDLDELIRSKKS